MADQPTTTPTPATGDPQAEPKPPTTTDPKAAAAQTEPATDPKAAAAQTDPSTDPKPGGELGEGGKAALDAERQAKRDAEKRATAAEGKLKTFEDAQLSETEKLQKEAEEGKALAATATDKLRKANLVSALSDHGLTGGAAKAAARLLDKVEFSDDDEPKNLEDAIKAAKAEFGEAIFTGATPTTPTPDLHPGARTPAPDADEDAQYSAYMKANFPQTAATPAATGPPGN